MYRIERAITKPYSDWMIKQIVPRYKRNQYTYDGDVTIFEWCKNRKIVAMFDANDPIAWVALDRTPNWAGWQVAQSFVKYHYRGNGYAVKLYSYVVNSMDLILCSGRSHTKYSAGLWAKFVERDLFNVYAVNFKNTNQTSPVIFDDGELYSKLPLYSDWPRKKADIRLVAVRKPNVRSNSKSTRS